MSDYVKAVNYLIVYCQGKFFSSLFILHQGDSKIAWELRNQIFFRGGRYPEEDAKAILRQILNVVSFCHLQGVVHRDLKPEVTTLKPVCFDTSTFYMILHHFFPLKTHFFGAEFSFYLQK